MKNMKWLLIIAAAFMAITGCRKDDPKALAKQTIDLTFDYMLVINSDPEKAEELYRQLEQIAEQAAKMSAEDQAIYQEESMRLTYELLESWQEVFGDYEPQDDSWDFWF